MCSSSTRVLASVVEQRATHDLDASQWDMLDQLYLFSFWPRSPRVDPSCRDSQESCVLLLVLSIVVNPSSVISLLEALVIVITVARAIPSEMEEDMSATSPIQLIHVAVLDYAFLNLSRLCDRFRSSWRSCSVLNITAVFVENVAWTSSLDSEDGHVKRERERRREDGKHRMTVSDVSEVTNLTHAWFFFCLRSRSEFDMSSIMSSLRTFLSIRSACQLEVVRWEISATE